MKLYYSPGACSLAPHIVLAELGLKHEMEKVDLKAHKTESGQDFYDVNPKGYVPFLIDDAGEPHSETAAMLVYLASLKPEKKMATLPGEKGFYKQLEWLTLVSSEFHKGIGVLAWVPIDDAAKAVLRSKTEARLKFVDEHLGKNPYLLGKEFNVADAYFYTVLNWASAGKIDLKQFPNIAKYHATIEARPGVQKAREMEGLPTAKKAA